MLEVAQEGSLLEFLQRHRPGQQEIVMGRGRDEPVVMRKQTLTAQKLLCLVAQVASGLEHLQKFKVGETLNFGPLVRIFAILSVAQTSFFLLFF